MDLLNNFLGLFRGRDNDKIENLEELLQSNDSMINKVVNDLLTPFLMNLEKKEFSLEKLNKLEYTLQLLDSDICADVAINLSSNIEKNMKKFKSSELGDDISLGEIKKVVKKIILVVKYLMKKL